jgi:fructose-1,6-bisphosphatase-3
MHKAITIIQMKLEGQLMEKYPEWEMEQRSLFKRIDFQENSINIDGKIYKLLDDNFPTVDKNNPLILSKGEIDLMTVLANSFMHSEKLHKHIKFMLVKGSMYSICNGNLLFHGCIPMDEKGELQSVNIAGYEYSGKWLFDKIDELVNKSYFLSKNTDEKEYACDFMWYLWCGSKSPLYGKDKMTFFERLYIDDESLHKENYNAYYSYSENADVCCKILNLFGLDENKGHIINGHVPVKIRNGESPIKAEGKLFVIDGGISKAYQKTTGIAGYTLIYDSHGISLAEHKPFISGKSEHTPKIQYVEKLEHRANISDTDKGKELLDKISDLRELLNAYKSGSIKEYSGE